LLVRGVWRSMPLWLGVTGTVDGAALFTLPGSDIGAEPCSSSTPIGRAKAAAGC